MADKTESKRESGKNGTVVMVCDGCKPHAFQDKTYGVGKRLFNRSGKSSGAANCTVCGKRKTF